MNRSLFSSLWPPLLGGLVALAAAILLRTIADTRLLAEVALDGMISVLPGRSFSDLLGVFGPYGKALSFFSFLLAQLVVYIVAWLGLRRVAPPEAETGRISLAAGLVVTVVFLFSAAVVITATAATLGPNTGWAGFSFATLMLSGLYAGIAGLQSLGVEAVEDGVEANSRRRFLRQLPGVALGGLALVVLGRTLRDAASGGVQHSRRGTPTPEVTNNDEFYRVSKNYIDPAPNGDDWRLKVDGYTDKALTLTYADMLAMPSQEQYTTMQCISNEVGGELMGNALWRGVPLKTVLDAAGIRPDAHWVFFRCEDDYTESIPLEFALRDQVILAYQMNGEELPKKHGFPVRLLSPGKYGIKHPKWITEILLLPDERLGYWQQQGWTREGRMNTTVRIDVPGGAPQPPEPLVIQGVSFSGDRGISRVEVSTDNSKTWHDATLKAPLGPYTWVHWEYDWRDPKPGEAVLVARATDGTGQLQRESYLDPFPDGAEGYHRAIARIEKPGQT
jgi:DMSO/TMAO reductase YedYZ molybdopterin-dependent catalytic subunit